MNNPYLELTAELNRGRLRVLLSSGQAVVVHRAQLLYSRSSRDLIQLAGGHPEALAEAMAQRPLLAHVTEGREALEEALDRERRLLMRANEERLARYQSAAEAWASIWPDVQRQIEGLPLLDAHRLVIARAEGILPFEPPREAAP